MTQAGGVVWGALKASSDATSKAMPTGRRLSPQDKKERPCAARREAAEQRKDEDYGGIDVLLLDWSADVEVADGMEPEEEREREEQEQRNGRHHQLQPLLEPGRCAFGEQVAGI